MKKIFLLLVILLVLTGCSRKNIIQMDGIPVPDKVISLKIFNPYLKVRYNFLRYFIVTEKDESFISYEFLDLLDKNIHKITEAKYLKIHLNIYNPTQKLYKVKQYTILEGGVEKVIGKYYGDLSVKEITFNLPLNEEKLVRFYFEILNENDELAYQSFPAHYVVVD